MLLPRWRQSLARSLHTERSKPESKFFQVASIALDEGTNKLTVENRTLVFRGFVDNSISLLAITDSRSDKYTQWLHEPQSEICWYFTETREQYRIKNSVTLIGQDVNDAMGTKASLRAQVWRSLSAKSKEQFLWPRPKQTVDEKPILVHHKASNIPETFVVLVFNPISVDYLNLTTIPQTRELHRISENTGMWVHSIVNP